MTETMKNIKDFYGIHNIWILIYFVFYIAIVLGFGILYLGLNQHSFVIGLGIGLMSPYIFKRMIRKSEHINKG